MKLLNFLILLFIISTSTITVVNADLTDDALKAIEDGYLSILSAEEAGGNVTVGVMTLNQAIDLISKGGEDNLRDAIALANEAKALGISTEQNSRTEQVYAYSRLLIFLIISFTAMILIRKYGNRVYYSLWASIKGDWRIEKA